MRMQTAPLFNVPRGRRGDTSFSITQIHSCTMPGPGIEPGPLPSEASALSTELHPPYLVDEIALPGDRGSTAAAFLATWDPACQTVVNVL